MLGLFFVPGMGDGSERYEIADFVILPTASRPPPLYGGRDIPAQSLRRGHKKELPLGGNSYGAERSFSFLGAASGRSIHAVILADILRLEVQIIGVGVEGGAIAFLRELFLVEGVLVVLV